MFFVIVFFAHLILSHGVLIYIAFGLTLYLIFNIFFLSSIFSTVDPIHLSIHLLDPLHLYDDVTNLLFPQLSYYLQMSHSVPGVFAT